MRELGVVTTGAPERYHALNALRGLLALGVVINHAMQINMGVRFGRVVLFFVVSGYCILQAASSLSDRGDLGPRSAGRFLWRRASRLWPPLACALALLAFMRWGMGFHGSGYRSLDSPLAWLQHLTFTNWLSLLGQTELPPWRNRTLLIGPHWTLGYEAQFYVFIACVLVANAVLKVRWAWVAWAMTIVGGAYFLALPATWTGTLIDYLLFFGIGGIVWSAISARPSWTLWSITAGVLGAFASVAAWKLSTLQSPGIAPNQLTIDRTYDWFAALLAGSLGAMVLLLAHPLDRWWRDRAGAKLLAALGTISYSLFLVHPINAPLARRLTDQALPEDPPKWLWFGIFLALQIGMAAGFWWLCERPWTKRRG